MESSSINQEVIEIANKEDEKLAGVLEGPPDGDVVILCHGFLSSKRSSTLQTIVPGLVEAGFGVLRFDFSGNGESGGEFEFGNYWKEVEDLRSVVGFVRGVKKRSVKAVLGHSKGGDVVILYAAKYGDVPIVVNVSGRFDLSRGVEERFGKEGLAAIAEHGYWDVKDSQGAVNYRVTKKSLEERLCISIEKAARTIQKNVRVLTVHGTADETIPVDDGRSFDKVIANHALVLVEGADHRYSRHREDLQQIVCSFIESSD
ncbi:esterase/lipase/thioesterase family protein [Klebsormidium nitens]|uniref:Esterase/lipase/thioesterase family protein n=1 Tax=Klebsormidium nitens TaxID=105231 RepID=A0A1Y1II24_KLENI|nr:esterase/lipase/thioesterase family protein [Klebsormidium nitens]|eukprot:GAQ88721.1 esterase/lipase/thioesterase family protein [Klebsormidium nitens]